MMKVITKEVVCPADPEIKLQLTSEGFKFDTFAGGPFDVGLLVGPNNEQAPFDGAWNYMTMLLDGDCSRPQYLSWLEHAGQWVVVDGLKAWQEFRVQAAALELEKWWKELAQIPRDKKSNLREPWRHFEKGAGRREVVRWFEITGNHYNLDFQRLRWKWK